jgi:outer membrane protein
MAQLREQYEAEQKRVENDFNKKYEEFLDGQASFPKTILQKRQSELQEMLDRNIEFKKQSQKMLSEAEANMMEVIKTTINMAVNIIAQERGYAFVLNTDKEAVTFINPALGEDITEAVKQLLNEETKNE